MNDCAFSPDGSFYISAGRTVKIWDTQAGKVRATLDGHKAEVNACAISPDSAFIVSASQDGTLKLWDSVTGTEQETIRHAKPFVGVTDCAFSPDGALIISVGNDGTIKIWEIATGEERTALHHHTDFLEGVAVSPDGTFCVTASNEGRRMVFQDSIPGKDFGTVTNALKVWDIETGRKRATLEGDTPTAGVCAVSPDASFIVAAHLGGILYIWDTRTGNLKTSTGDGSLYMDCAVSSDGAYIITASFDGTLKLWDAKTGAEKTSVVFPNPLECVALHPHKPLVICGDTRGELHTVDLVGVRYGPIIVTPLDMGKGPAVRCPKCSKLLPVQESWLGKTIACPERGCNGRLRVNPFTAGPPARVRKARAAPGFEDGPARARGGYG